MSNAKSIMASALMAWVQQLIIIGRRSISFETSISSSEPVLILQELLYICCVWTVLLENLLPGITNRGESLVT